MFSLSEVVPWGRSFDEYRRMFALSDADSGSTIIGCGDGPASFNAEATRRGIRVTSCDPIYRFDVSELRRQIEATTEQIIDQTRRNEHEFVWTSIRSIEELRDARLAAMQLFLDDFQAGKAAGRYVDAALPVLPFPDASFDLALSSHFLFLYTAQIGEAAHRDSIREMCRVAREVRIFPLLALGGAPSTLDQPMIADLRAKGFVVEIERVPYEFQRGGNEMMTIRRHGASR